MVTLPSRPSISRCFKISPRLPFRSSRGRGPPSRGVVALIGRLRLAGATASPPCRRRKTPPALTSCVTPTSARWR
eukprot:scaffold53_cov193-Pinguiococcus_pyrenoidosus.AAC.33